MENLVDRLCVLGVGKLALSPFVKLKNTDIQDNKYKIEVEKNIVIMSYKNGLYEDVLKLNFCNDEITCKRRFKNLSKLPLDVCELGVKIDGVTFGELARDDYFYHVENPRIYQTLTFSIDYKSFVKNAKDSEFDVLAGNKWADSGVVCDRIGASPYQPFPAILISNYNTNLGLVCGSLCQDVCYHNYLLNHDDGKICFKIMSSFKAVDALDMASGRVIDDEWYMGTTLSADNIEKIFERYSAVLRKKIAKKLANNKENRLSTVWGSWNDGNFRNISHDMLLAEAKSIKKYFPNNKWLQLDDGYASYNKSAHGLGSAFEEDGIDKIKFPYGLKGFTTAVKKTGLKPAIWVGAFCPHETKIYKQHPEWFIDYSFRCADQSPLDVSQKDVRAYMKRAIKTLCHDSGFDGVKHDFWSYAFEDSHDLYKNKTVSGYEYRSWWLRTIKKQIARDGYFQTGCDIVMNNPFLAQYFTNYRYGIDVGTGDWSNIKTNFLWGVACFATHTGDMFIPNSDAVGLFPALNDTDFMFTLNFIFITHSMVEIAGNFSQIACDNKRLAILQKATCNINNGQDVYFADYDYRANKYCVPEVLYTNTPFFTNCKSQNLPLKTIGVFNINEYSKSVNINLSSLGLGDSSFILTDIWSHEQIEISKSVEVKLAAHESRMFSLSKKVGLQIYDSNVKITTLKVCENKITATIQGAEKVELVISEPPKEIYLARKKISFTRHNNTVLLTMPISGKLTFVF